MDTIPQEPEKVYIYTLSSPSEPEKIRYVGKTINPKRRLAQHIHNASKNHRGNWLSLLRTQGLTPIMTIIEETTSDQWKEREIFWVAFYRDHGHDLTNSTEGGDGHDIAPETRTKISEAAKSRKREPFSEEWRQRLGDVSRGKKQSPEHVTKRAAAQRGSKHTDETKAKLSSMRKGKPLKPETKDKLAAIQATPEYKEKQAAAHRGKKATPEARAKISAAGRGRKQSPESIEKTAAANRGTKRSPETCAKIAAAKANTSPETRAKISASLTGKKLSPETIEKRSVKIRGRKHSPEAIAKMSEARKRWHTMKNNPPEQLPLWD